MKTCVLLPAIINCETKRNIGKWNDKYKTSIYIVIYLPVMLFQTGVEIITWMDILKFRPIACQLKLMNVIANITVLSLCLEILVLPLFSMCVNSSVVKAALMLLLWWFSSIMSWRSEISWHRLLAKGKHVCKSEFGVEFVFHSCSGVIIIISSNFLSRKYVCKLKEI